MLNNIYNGTVTLDDLKDKVVFWDIDGVLAPYRWNDHLADPTGKTDNGQSVEEIENGCFLHRKPSVFMTNIVMTLPTKSNIVLSHCQNNTERADKNIWLDTYFGGVFDDILMPDMCVSKAACILLWCETFNEDLKNVVFVDDSHSILREAERKGIKSYHISSFLDFQF